MGFLGFHAARKLEDTFMLGNPRFQFPVFAEFFQGLHEYLHLLTPVSFSFFRAVIMIHGRFYPLFQNHFHGIGSFFYRRIYQFSSFSENLPSTWSAKSQPLGLAPTPTFTR